MRIAVGADHAGYPLKQALAHHLTERGHEVVDVGTDSEERCDYPDFGAAVARAVAADDTASEGAADLGLCVCGTGIGMSIAANKVDGVRAALVHDTDTARLAREHNDANVVCIGARTTPADTAVEALDAFLDTPFAGGRHAGRVQKIASLEAPT